MDSWISWLATAFTIVAALMTASNLGSRITGYGFVVFAVGSVAWIATALMTSQPALLWTNAVLFLLNILGVWRWLGREQTIEEGGQAAQRDSQQSPGETLFPASLLGQAKLVGDDGKPLGSLVDAMIGCSSGRISYAVAGKGGVAGIGETFRKLEWSEVRSVGKDRLVIRLDAASFTQLPTLEKDEWPGR